jgi:hypothetical protein
MSIHGAISGAESACGVLEFHVVKSARARIEG